MTITCKYSCKACGLNRVALEVPARQLQSVTVWMEETAQCISADPQAPLSALPCADDDRAADRLPDAARIMGLAVRSRIEKAMNRRTH